MDRCFEDIHMAVFRSLVALCALYLSLVAGPAAGSSRGFMDQMFGPPSGMELTQARPAHQLQLQAPPVSHPALLRQVVPYATSEPVGTIIVDTRAHYLYLVMADGKAMRYGIGVARTGFEWRGTHRVTAKREWPSWTPPAEMHARQPGLPRYMEGGPNNPMGARALYLGSTLYRIHGTNEPWTIGRSVSSGCIRMTNQDVVDLYTRVRVGTKVIVV
jgi:lipoprotein-anchoring transpeptidase ErfK/SrfK